MVSHVDPVYEMAQLHHQALLDEAARERRAAQAKSQVRHAQRRDGSRLSMVAAVGWRLGAALIGMGTWLQGGPRTGAATLPTAEPSLSTSG